MCEAAHAPYRKRAGGSLHHLQRGETIASVRFLAKAWHWSEARVRRYLARLERADMIAKSTDAGITRLTIANYDHFQAGSRVAGAPESRRRPEQEKKKARH